MLENDNIYAGDCLSLIKDIPNNYIDMTLTSPPYDNLRDYNGYSVDVDGVIKELYRVTKDGGVVVWIVNDATVKARRQVHRFAPHYHLWMQGLTCMTR